jgi:hypothetical protein
MVRFALTRRRSQVRGLQRPPAKTTFSGDVAHAARAVLSYKSVRSPCAFQMLQRSPLGGESRRESCREVRTDNPALAEGCLSEVRMSFGGLWVA